MHNARLMAAWVANGFRDQGGEAETNVNHGARVRPVDTFNGCRP